MKKAIFGNGGHSREIQSYFDFEVDIFVDDEYVDGNLLPLSKFDVNKHEILVAVSDSQLRKSIISKLPKETIFFSFIHPSAIISGKVNLGKGCFIGPNCILTTNITLGDHSLLNRGNHIGHDCIIGNFFSLMPGSIISGNNEIGNCVYLGANSATREKIKICDEVKIGMNSGVLTDITQSGTYIGTPVKLLKK